MEFEFDAEKSSSNRQKHGIDFQAAQALWDDPDLIEVPARTTDESRFLVIGQIAGKPGPRSLRTARTAFGSSPFAALGRRR